MPVLRLFLDANVLFGAGCYAVEEARPSAMEVAASAALADPADVPILPLGDRVL